MASRYHRGLEHHHLDLENMISKNVKDTKVAASRPALQVRPALGELGNRFAHLQQTAVVGKKAEAAPAAAAVAPTSQALLKPVKPSKEGKTKSAPQKENRMATKTVDLVTVLPTKTHRQQHDNVPKAAAVVQKTDKVVKAEEAVADDDDDEKTSYSSRQFEIADPDVANRHDPLLAVEYLADIFSYLRELEDLYPIRARFLEGHRVTPRMRGILVNWLVEVHSNFKFCLETLHMCISIVDRYLQEDANVDRETLQLVGTSAMLVASKYEEMYTPELSDFVYICDDTFSKRQILLTEIDILKRLNFTLGRPLSIHFLRRYSKVGQVRPEHHNLSKYILELALLDYETCHIRPSIQAAAACCLSIAILDEVSDPSKVWTPTFVHYTTYEYEEFSAEMAMFARLLKKAEVQSNAAIREKYASASYAKISLNAKLKGWLVRKLAHTPHSKQVPL